MIVCKIRYLIFKDFGVAKSEPFLEYQVSKMTESDEAIDDNSKLKNFEIVSIFIPQTHLYIVTAAKVAFDWQIQF